LEAVVVESFGSQPPTIFNFMEAKFWQTVRKDNLLQQANLDLEEELVAVFK
jgi:hypothetical protein